MTGTSQGAPAEGRGPVLGGLEVEQVAGVHAALAEGFALTDVLAQEQIDPAEWPAAERAWREALVDSPALQITYAQKLREAEDCLGREITPLAGDPGAWAGLVGAISLADKPESILKALGLTMSDFSRLGRAWRRKAEADPEVGKKLTDLAGKTPSPKSVQAAPAALKPFPWSRGASAARPAEGPSTGAASAAPGASSRLATPIGGLLPVESDMDLYAALRVVLELAPSAASKALALCGMSAARHAEITAAWRERLEDPAVQAELTVKELDHREVVKRMLRGARLVIG